VKKAPPGVGKEEIMSALAFPIGAPELLIILVIVLLLFGGTRLAGLGKSSGRALKEFKEETKGLRDNDKAAAEGTTVDPRTAAPTQAVTGPSTSSSYQQSPYQTPGQQVPPNNLADPSSTDVRRDV